MCLFFRSDWPEQTKVPDDYDDGDDDEKPLRAPPQPSENDDLIRDGDAGEPQW